APPGPTDWDATRAAPNFPGQRFAFLTHNRHTRGAGSGHHTRPLGPDRHDLGGVRMKHLVRTIIAMAMVVGSLTGLAGVTLSQPAAASSGKAPINIGDIASLTGPEASSIDQTTEVLEAWVKTVSARGGIQGHKVNL